MTKASIKSGIISSIKKWERIKLHEGSYKDFWDSCGYCENFDCSKTFDCPLYIRKSTRLKMRYCHSSYMVKSVASEALRAGDKYNFSILIEYADILIAKMKRDLKKFQ